MPADARSSPAKWPAFLGNPGAFLRALVFFALIYHFLRIWVDLRLIYHGGGVLVNFPVFYWGGDFLREFLARPGGILDYAGAGLSQCLIHPWLGPLAITVLAWLLSFTLVTFLEAIGAGPLRFLGFVPPLLLLALHAKYVYHVSATHTALTLLAGGIPACLHTKFRPTRLGLRWASILGMAAAAYLVAGGALVVFAVLCLLCELRGPERWRMLPVFPLLAGWPFLAGLWLYHLTPPEIVAELFPFTLSTRVFRSEGLALLYALYLVLPLGAAGWLLWRGVARRRFLGGPPAPAPAPPHPSPKDKAAPETPRHHASGGAGPAASDPAGPKSRRVLWRWLAGSLALWVGAGVVARGSANPELKAVLEVDFYGYQKMWPRVLEAARGATNNLHVVCATCQALYHSGRLGDDLPLTPNPQALLLYDQKFRPDWNVIDIYLDLGFINMAHHYLAEAIDIYGERPALLRRLALVNVAIGNAGTARIYFHALARVPFHAAWARDYLRQLDADPLLAGDEEVARLRALAMKVDHVIPLPLDTLMLKLLEQNAHNRMAFEYLMAYYLLTKNLKAFAAQWRRLDDFNWGEMPRYHQEAIILAARNLGLKPDLKGRRVGEDYLRRHDDFMRRRQVAGADRARAAEDLRKDYGDSYWYFYYLD